MKTDYDLELGLLPPFNPCNENMMEQSRSSGTLQKRESQQMTIFYNGRICVSHLTDLQARSIMTMARKEMEERSSRTKQQHLQLHHPTKVASVKRSLQQFLQKRKDRIRATSPY